jgi:hypothetical protein
VLLSFCIFLLSASRSSTLRGSKLRERESSGGCCVGVHPSGPISTNRLKSDTFATLSHSFAYVLTQFGCTIKTIQCGNGREFDNSASLTFFLTEGVSLRMSCPYTSQQNGKAERMLRTINNVTCSLLFQASMPPCYWADALATATLLINRLPTKTLHMSTPFFALHRTNPSYHDLRAFGCSCYPNLTATTPHKLAPCSTLCAFLGYSPDHKGNRCLDLDTTNRVIISRHVVFDETTFPFWCRQSSPPAHELDFLTDDDALPVSFSPAGAPGAPNAPVPAPGSGSRVPRSPRGFPVPGARRLASCSPPPGFSSPDLRSPTPAPVLAPAPAPV